MLRCGIPQLGTVLSDRISRGPSHRPDGDGTGNSPGSVHIRSIEDVGMDPVPDQEEESPLQENRRLIKEGEATRERLKLAIERLQRAVESAQGAEESRKGDEHEAMEPATAPGGGSCSER